MRKFAKPSVLVTAFFLFLFSSGVQAAEVFLMLSFKDYGKVYRVKTDYEELRPVGFFFSCKPCDGFFIDNFKDFRMLSGMSGEKFVPSNRSLFRQVFDGDIKEADYGQGTSQHQDQRENLVKDSYAKPVYRPVGAPLSAGTGRKISLRPRETDFAEGEVDIFPEHNWYQIPNSSWYQTWIKDGDFQDSGNLVYFDEWQKGEVEVIESIWRGEQPTYVAQRVIEKLAQRRLFRAVTDGSLEMLGNFPKGVIVSEGRDNYAWSFNPGFNFSKGELLLYSWSDENPGKLSIVGGRGTYPLLLESKSPKQRFVSFAGSGAIVVGTDILRDWLTEAGMAEESLLAECSQASFCQKWSENEIMVFVYSEPDRSLYFFNFDFAARKLVGQVKKVALQVSPDCIFADIAGNLLISYLEQIPPEYNAEVEPQFDVETVEFQNVDHLEFDETQGKFVDQSLPPEINGRMVFSKGYRQSLYVVRKGFEVPEFVKEVDLGRKYFYREFILKKPSLDLLSSSYSQVIELARKPENKLTEMKSDVPGFPDQFEKPEKVFIGFFQQ